MHSPPPAILIHGPTASGKTALAIDLAAKLGGEIVNADAVQVYRELRILSARPTDAELARAPHHLFGHQLAAQRGSAGQWLSEAGPVIRGIQNRGRVPVVVGGTGLYMLALVQGLSDIPPVPEETTAQVREILQSEGVAGLRARLAHVDPEGAAKLGTGDRQRLSRAYAVWMATGRPLSAFQDARQAPVLPEGEWLGIALTPRRDRLYARIDRRFESMMMHGAMDEARRLAEQNLDPELPAMKAHGMPWLLRFLHGHVTAGMAAEGAKRDTRRYAKRQFTWIGRQFPFWPRVPSILPTDRLRVILALYSEVQKPVWNNLSSAG